MLAAQIGWLFLAIGSLAFWAFAWNADLSGWRFQQGATGRIAGESMGCRDTGYAEGGARSPHGGPRIYQNLYRYTVDGRPFQTSSFATRCISGGTVPVEYLLARPETSRIAGMRRALLGPGATFAMLFPALGLAFALPAFVRGRRALRLLRDGEPAPARLIEKSATGARTMNRPVYRMTFSYAVNGAESTVTTRTHLPERLEGEPAALLLYDPRDPRQAVLTGSLLGALIIDEAGQPSAPRSRAFLLLPALTILENIWRGMHL
jgi:hypothetical protein